MKIGDEFQGERVLAFRPDMVITQYAGRISLWVIPTDPIWGGTEPKAVLSIPVDEIAQLIDLLKQAERQVKLDYMMQVTIGEIMNLAAYLKVMRESHEMTQREVSEKTGLSVSYVSDLERGRTLPSLKTLEKLAACYEMTLTIQFNGKEG